MGSSQRPIKRRRPNPSRALGGGQRPFARYNVVGNANEHGLAIGETTFGGLGILDGNGGVGIIDYGSLIWLTLQVGSL